MHSPTPIIRVIVVAGHGLSNVHNGVFDSGAVGCGTTEAELVAAVADEVDAHFFRAADSQATATANVTVVPAPVCSRNCAEKNHPTYSHLGYVIQWCNEVFRRGDLILSLHMNEGAPEASGALVVYDDGAPAVRHQQAEIVAQTLASVLGIPSRGAMADSATPRKHIGIVEKTTAPSLLFELGFVSNQGDVDAVRAKGALAVIAAINRLVGCQ